MLYKREQFTPANARPVDMSIIDDMEAKPERPFHAISSMEVEEGLKNTSNFSAPGPDHVSTFICTTNTLQYCPEPQG